MYYNRLILLDGTLIEDIETIACLSLIPEKDSKLLVCQLKITVAEQKLDEFIDTLLSLADEIRKEDGCLDFSFYRDLQRKEVYRVFGEWKSRQAMEAHFKRKQFTVLIGAARVLGKDLEMSIGETLEKGNYPFAHQKISLQVEKGSIQYTKPQTASEI